MRRSTEHAIEAYLAKRVVLGNVRRIDPKRLRAATNGENTPKKFNLKTPDFKI
jgi:hypothetical protein